MPGMKRSKRSKSSKSHRRSRRGGLNTDNPAFEAKMAKVARQAAETQVLADSAGSAVNIAANAQEKLNKDLNKLPSICKNPFMANNKRCKQASAKLAQAKTGAKTLSFASKGIQQKADALKLSGLSKVGGRRGNKSRRKSRKGGRKSRSKSRRKSRKGGRKSRSKSLSKSRSKSRRKSRKGGRKSRSKSRSKRRRSSRR